MARKIVSFTLTMRKNNGIILNRHIVSNNQNISDFNIKIKQKNTHTFRRHIHRAKRIILIRHGESEGNVDESAYVNTADWQIRLTQKGKDQAHYAGKKLRELLKDDESIFFYVSPYKRTIETLEQIQSHFSKNQIWGVREEPRIAEQQFGNFQNVDEVRKAKTERKKFGRFFFRFPNGESGLDVYSSK